MGTTQAQDALRATLEGQSFARDREVSRTVDPLGLKLGPVTYSVTTYVDLTYDSNVFLDDSNTQDDFVVAPGATLDAYWPIDGLSALNVSLAVSYLKYFDYNDKDQLSIPLSAISYRRVWQDFRLDIHDRFLYSENPANDGSARGIAKFGGFENTAGIQGVWMPLDAFSWALGYDHYNYISTTSASEHRERGAEYLHTRAEYAFLPYVKAGPEASAGFTRYDRNTLSDNESYSLGAFLDVKITSTLTLEPHAGYAYYSFDSSDTLATASSRDTWYANLLMAHTLNRQLSQTLEGGLINELGSDANLDKTLYAAYAIRYRFNSRVDSALAAGIYDVSEEEGSLATAGDSSYLRYSASPSVRVRLSNHAYIGASYRFIRRDSDLPNNDYDVHQATLRLSYQF